MCEVHEMKIKKIIAGFFSALLLAVIPGCAKETAESRSPVEITVFSVGKADAILVRAEDSIMLIDCGEMKNASYLLSELEKRGITHLDILQITHFDKDHVGGAAQIAENLEIDRIIYPDYEGTRPEYLLFMETIKDRKAAGTVTEITELPFGSAALTVYPAEDPDDLVDEDSEYDNEMSLVTRMQYGDNVFLFCGDAEKKRVKQMCKSDTDWKCDWIKLPHHGKYDKQIAKFLELCGPSYAVATVSEDEPADGEIKELLASLGAEYYDTLGGNVITTSDGKTIVVK